MAYTHLTMKELGWIEIYYETGLKLYKIAKKLGRLNQPIYNVVNYLKEGWIPNVASIIRVSLSIQKILRCAKGRRIYK